MMAIMLRESPTKRLKTSVAVCGTAAVDRDDEISNNSTLGGIEDNESDDDDDDDDDHPLTSAREEALLDHVLAIYDQYEEDALVEQNRLRNELTACSKSQTVALHAQLSDAKIKCSLMKILTLLIQSDSSRLKGRIHIDRMHFMRQVKRILLDNDLDHVSDLKIQFVQLIASQRRHLFPPCSIAIPSTVRMPTDSPFVAVGMLDQSTLRLETLRVMAHLEELAQNALATRLANGDFHCSIMPSRGNDEEDCQDWESIREVWNAWLQFPAKTAQQLEIWQETLTCPEHLSSLLWNLSYYLSIDDSVPSTQAC